MPDINKTLVVPYTCSQMYDLVNAIEQYPEFLPWCESAEIHHRDSDEVKASLVLYGAGIRKSFTTLNRLQKNKMIEIVLLDGPFKHLEGFWRFDDVGTEKSQVSLDLEFELPGGLLNFAFGPIFHQMANTLVDAFSARADDVYGSN
jgi:ribosome-associated toxin RatA of RatAB toxin-antitoxin module